MTPPPRGRGRGREPDQLLAHIRRKRRERVRRHRRRVAHFVAGTGLAIVIVLSVTGFTGAAVWMSSCDLNSLMASSTSRWAYHTSMKAWPANARIAVR